MDVNLFEPFTYEGQFWLPERPEYKIRGELEFVPSKSITLKLTEHLGRGAGDKWKVILGQFVNGTTVTLLDAFMKQVRWGMAGPGSCSVFCNRAIVGEAVHNPVEYKYSRAELHPTCLDAWTGGKPFQWDHTNDDKDRCTFTPLPTIAIPISGADFSVSIESYMITNCKTFELHAANRTFLSLDFSPSKSLEQILSLSSRFQDLLSLLCGVPVVMRSLQLVPEGCSSDAEQLLRRSSYVAISRVDKPKDELLIGDILVPLGDIHPHLGNVISTWLEMRSQIAHAMNLFFGTLYDPPKTSDYRFLTMAHALETYHRASGNGTYMDDALYVDACQQIYGTLPDAIAGDHRVSLKNRIRFGNEFSFRKRLMDLLQRVPPRIRDSITEGSKEFVHRIVATRNYYTHFGADDEEAKFDGPGLRIAADRLRLLLWALLLGLVGIRPDRIEERLLQVPEMQWACEKKIMGTA